MDEKWLDSAKAEFKSIIDELNSTDEMNEKVRILYEAVSFTYKFFNQEVETLQKNYDCGHYECGIKNLLEIVLSTKSVLDNGVIPMIEQYTVSKDEIVH